MSKINVLVVEDESIVSKDIQHSLKKLGYEVVGAAATGEKAVMLAKSVQPDIVLMDIMLKGEMNGIEAAEQIRNECQIPIVFLTAYADETTLSKAKITESHGYILKPFKEIDLKINIEMSIYKHSKEQEVLKERDFLFALVENKEQPEEKKSDSVFVKSNGNLVKIIKTDICFIEALKDYVIINTAEKRFTVHSTMKDIIHNIGNGDFLRVHRSFIVRVDKIQKIKGQNIIIEGVKKTIPIGGSYKDELNKRLYFL